MKLLSTLVVAAAAAQSSAFVVGPAHGSSAVTTSTSLPMGMFDFFSEDARKEREERKQREIEEQERLQQEIIERRKVSDYYSEHVGNCIVVFQYGIMLCCISRIFQIGKHLINFLSLICRAYITESGKDGRVRGEGGRAKEAPHGWQR